MDELRKDNETAWQAYQKAHDQPAADGLLDHDDPLRVNAECHGEVPPTGPPSRSQTKWLRSTSIPAFVQGNCQTHNVADEPDIKISGGVMMCSGNLSAYECGEAAKKRIQGRSWSTPPIAI